MNLKCSCGKTRFRKKIEALFALVRIQREGPREPEGQVPRRAYPCRICGGYHLTSQEQRGRGEGETRGSGEGETRGNGGGIVGANLVFARKEGRDMDVVRFIEQAYWSGWLKGLFLGGVLGGMAMMAICLRDEIKLAWRRARVKERS